MLQDIRPSLTTISEISPPYMLMMLVQSMVLNTLMLIYVTIAESRIVGRVKLCLRPS